MRDRRERSVDRYGHVHPFGGEFSHSGVVSGDLEELVEQRLEAIEFFVEQLDGSFTHGVEVVAALVEDIAGHADRRERCTEFMADIGGELSLQTTELLEVGDLLGQALGHVVERHRQAGHVILAAHRHSFLEAPIGEAHGNSRRRPHRHDGLPGYQPCDGREQAE